MRTLSFLLVTCLVLLPASGCGRSGRPALGRVHGTVSYQGKPLLIGSMIFEVSGARQAQGKIVQGKITEVGTFDRGDGIPVGTARIAVFAYEADVTNASASMNVGKSLIPNKYNDPSTSGLTWKIESGDNEIILDLK